MKFRQLKIGQEFKFDLDNAVLHRVSVLVRKNIVDDTYYRNNNTVWPIDDVGFNGDVFTKETIVIPEKTIPEHKEEVWKVT